MKATTVSIVIPAYNEERRLQKSLEKLKAFLIQPNDRYNFELVFVNDGSRDNTVKLLKESNLAMVLVDNAVNKGKGAALRDGVRNATGEFIYLCDLDLSTPIEEVYKFLQLSEKYNCIIGSRALDGAKVQTLWYKRVLGRVGNWCIAFLLGLNLKDTQCGFKLLDKRAVEQYLMTTIDRWGADFEFLFLATRAGLEIKELPIKWINDEDSRVNGLDYFKTLRELLYIWIKYRLPK